MGESTWLMHPRDSHHEQDYHILQWRQDKTSMAPVTICTSRALEDTRKQNVSLWDKQSTSSITVHFRTINFPLTLSLIRFVHVFSDQKSSESAGIFPDHGIVHVLVLSVLLPQRSMNID